MRRGVRVWIRARERNWGRTYFRNLTSRYGIQRTLQHPTAEVRMVGLVSQKQETIFGSVRPSISIVASTLGSLETVLRSIGPIAVPPFIMGIYVGRSPSLVIVAVSAR